MKRYSFIDVTKFLAVLLVLNSHMDNIYPISALATGGAIGNGLFFFASGFLSTNVNDNFTKWYSKRIVRLLPMTSVMALIRILVLNKFQITTAFFDLVFPTYYWFVAAILIFDIPLYFLVKSGFCAKYRIQLLVGLAVCYFIYYFTLLDTSKWVVESAGMTSVAGCFKLIYYFAIMLLGCNYKLSLSNGKEIENNSKPNIKLLLLSGASFVAFYAFKIVMDKSIVIMRLQFIQQFLTIVIVVSFAHFLFSVEYIFQRYKTGTVMKVITYIGSISLELFLVQEIIVLFAQKTAFPLSFAIMVVGSFLGAAVLNHIYKWTHNIIKKVK